MASGWSLTATCPSGESVCRQFLYGQRYLADHLGVTATVGYNVDSFGHAGTLPQLLAASGIGAYVMMRPGRDEKEIPSPAFLWRGADGTELPAYRIPYDYSTGGAAEDELIRKRAGELLERERGRWVSPSWPSSASATTAEARPAWPCGPSTTWRPRPGRCVR